MSEQLIADATGALASRAVHLRQGEEVTVKVSGTLAAGEPIDVQLSSGEDEAFADYYSNGNQVQLTTTNTALAMVGPCIFKLNKGVTAGTAGATMNEPNLP